MMSARTRSCVREDAVFIADAVTRLRTVKTCLRVNLRPQGKRGRGRTSKRRPRTGGRKGRPDDDFHPKTSVMTTLSPSSPKLYDNSKGLSLSSSITVVVFGGVASLSGCYLAL